MLSKKPLILTLVIAFSVHCSNGRAQENRLPLRFALAVGKALINAPEPFIEVLSIKRVYVTGAETILLPLFPIQDGLADEQESVAIEWWELKVHSRAASDHGSDSEGSCTSDGSSDNCSNEDEDEANTESDVWYETTTVNPFRVANEISEYCTILDLKKIKQEPVSDSEIHTNSASDKSIDNRSNEDEFDVQYETTTLNPFRVSNEISQHGATLELKKIKEEPVSDSEILTDSEVDVTKVDAVRHQCDHEGCNYRTDWVGNLKAHKQTHLPADQRLKVYQCNHEGCDYRTDYMGNLKKHKQTHLPADQRAKVHQCDYEGCGYSTDNKRSLKRHKQTHLPADQRLKVHQCDHEGCSYSSRHPHNLKRHKQIHLSADQRAKRPKIHQCDDAGCNYSSNLLDSLKRHKLIHLPADQRPKVHQCDHEGCNYSTKRSGDLKRHKQIHLPANQRPKKPKVHQCDHEGCNYSTGNKGHLKTHKQTHLPTDQRLKKPRNHQCEHEDCDYSTDRAENLKWHKQTHLPADQRPKRKACDQPPSNAKRKKGDKE
ncbi:C2H2-type zinc finger protein [Endozoicomonas sp. 4G]|uniref:C2H2-type zinc finger protein n=1 Tax=Endozoicomonas sp. 4G TaxID=2872754 RepID=UPI002078DADB|nr:C2H2-type zinc finger protein [Endozoicomonas sp. 4G]